MSSGLPGSTWTLATRPSGPTFASRIDHALHARLLRQHRVLGRHPMHELRRLDLATHPHEVGLGLRGRRLRGQATDDPTHHATGHATLDAAFDATLHAQIEAAVRNDRLGHLDRRHEPRRLGGTRDRRSTRCLACSGGRWGWWGRRRNAIADGDTKNARTVRSGSGRTSSKRTGTTISDPMRTPWTTSDTTRVHGYPRAPFSPLETSVRNSIVGAGGGTARNAVTAIGEGWRPACLLRSPSSLRAGSPMASSTGT